MGRHSPKTSIRPLCFRSAVQSSSGDLPSRSPHCRALLSTLGRWSNHALARRSRQLF